MLTLLPGIESGAERVGSRRERSKQNRKKVSDSRVRQRLIKY